MSAHSDKRLYPRIRSLLGARIVFNNRNSTMNCVVREMSAGGAKIEFSDAKSIPENFELVIPSKNQHYLVKVRWRHGNSLGVEFQLRDSQGSGPAANESAMTQLERENANLRQQLAAMRMGDAKVEM